MDRTGAEKLLLQGRIFEWNQRRLIEKPVPELDGANFNGVDLTDVDLGGMNLDGAVLREATLSSCNLEGASLVGADLSGIDLRSADLDRTNLRGATLDRADLRKANLNCARLMESSLRCADLRQARLMETDFTGAELTGAKFHKAICQGTLFCAVNLAEVTGLNKIHHEGPSHITTDSLAFSSGRIPGRFLQQCGLAPWEIISARMYDSSLTPRDIEELQYKVFDLRAQGPLVIGGIFISYSWTDEKFVNKLYRRLVNAGASVWLDRHSLVAGPLQKQVFRAIRLNDVVIVVLSRNSTKSDWVENELEMARRKEIDESRDVLCPIAIDDSWKTKMNVTEPNRALWLTLKQKLVIDFSKWRSKAFEPAFEKLYRGLKIYYPPKDSAQEDEDKGE